MFERKKSITTHLRCENYNKEIDFYDAYANYSIEYKIKIELICMTLFSERNEKSIFYGSNATKGFSSLHVI